MCRRTQIRCWKLIVVCILGNDLSATTTAEAADPQPFRVVLTKFEKADTPHTAELIYKIDHDFGTGPLQLPFSATSKEGEFSLQRDGVELKGIVPKKVNTNEQLLIDLPDSMKGKKQSSRVTVSGSVTVTLAAADKPYQSSHEIDLESHPSRMVRKIAVNNKTNVAWGVNGRLQIVLKTQPETGNAREENHLTVDDELGKDERKIYDRPLAMKIKSKTVLLSVSDFVASPPAVVKQWLTLDYSGTEGADDELPAGTDVELIRPFDDVKSALKITTTLYHTASCTVEKCGGTCNTSAHVQRYDIGVVKGLDVKCKASPSAAWLPLHVTTDAVHYLQASKLEFTVVNCSSEPRTVSFFDGIEDKGFVATPATMTLDACNGRGNATVWYFNCKSVSIVRTATTQVSTDQAEQAKKLAENLEHLLDLNDECFRKDCVWQGLARADDDVHDLITKEMTKKKLKTGEYRKYFEQLKKTLKNIKQGADTFLGLQLRLDELQRKQIVLSQREQMLSTGVGADDRRRELIGLRLELHDLAKEVASLTKRVEAAQAQFAWAWAGGDQFEPRHPLSGVESIPLPSRTYLAGWLPSPPPTHSFVIWDEAVDDGRGERITAPLPPLNCTPPAIAYPHEF